MNNTERFTTQFYQYINVSRPSELTVSNICERLNVDLHYWEHSSAVAKFNVSYKVFLNKKNNSRQQWQDFGHEMSHYFRDQGNRNVLRESFVDYCETKADYFSYHFCVPTFMLMELKGVTVYDVMNLFNVEFD